MFGSREAYTAVPPVEPRATYRVQFQAGFTFENAAEIVPYLAKLGVSHLYCSPCLQAVPGSTHGYDVIDHSRVSEELGGAEAYERLTRELARYGMALLLDVVPNHMAIRTPGNRWWWDVLENGPASRYAAYFDVDWDPPEAKLRNTVLLPVLPDHYGRVLERGDIKLERRGGALLVRYGDSELPVAPTSLDGILQAAERRCGSQELSFLADEYARLPLSTALDHESLWRRHRDKEVLRGLLERLAQQQKDVAAAIDSEVEAVNEDKDALDALLNRQNYRLAYWRTAARDLGYRRFFDVNHLVGLRVEDDRVFADTHDLIVRECAAGRLAGLRVDHPDGLRDPEVYLSRLAALSPRPWLVVEKVLGADEEVPETWPVDGTTGYDFLNRVGRLFVDPAGEEALTRFYVDFTGEPIAYAELLRGKKEATLRDGLGSDLNRLTALFLEVCERHRRHRDYTRHELHEALREVAARFPVYRTYIRPQARSVRPADERYVTQAIEAARASRTDLDPALFDFLRDLLLLRVRGSVESELVLRFQQLTGPAVAKGVEDCAFYCFNRLVSLNEVGGDPTRFGSTPAEFHDGNVRTQARWPRTLLATSTHDTKRSEDVRARLHLLSEIPARWQAVVKRWSAAGDRIRRGGPPDRNAEYLFYQTVVGAWPIDVERASAYMLKAAREAKQHTSWTNPDPAYETALTDFVREMLLDRRFASDVESFVASLNAPGRVNSLAQTLLKLVSPGVPDFYQGSELWDLSLVDPDNRRLVDYEKRGRLQEALAQLSPEEILARADEGLPKLWLIQRALTLRKQAPRQFLPGAAYQPVHALGSRASHVVALRRGEAVLAVAPRLVLGLAGIWADTALPLPPGEWTNLLTGDGPLSGSVRMLDLLRRFPVALLSRTAASA
jgi:(1->4)-alpha-D-glucan 1-alpha-D-glucosylmutase